LRREKSVELRTERLLLRPWAPSDAETLYQLARDQEVGPAAGWPAHADVGESLDTIRGVLAAPETYAIVQLRDGALVGCVALRFGEDSCSGLDAEPELGFWVGRPHWGCGYATEAASCMVDRAFADLGCDAVWCCHYDGNARSARVQQKLGFEFVRLDPNGDTRLGYTLPEVENVLRRDRWECLRA
jgi:ribosomal-protein-alanine N-acetyltransferase